MTDEDEIKAAGSASGSGSGASTRRGSSSSTSSGFLRFKNIPDSGVMNSLQIGIQHTVGTLDGEPERDLLIRDFMAFQSVWFPAKGSDTAPPHDNVTFKFLNYAPIAFKCFRGLFKIKSEKFLNSMCSASLRQLENPGASGSTFYLTHDDAFILKTVQERETDFLLKLLPGYYLNLTQNPRTLLPKFFGFYCYSTLNRNIRIVVMNNLIPSNVSITQKYDLKGSTSKRKATQTELRKSCPTYKDLDFMEHYPDGLMVDFDTYNALKHALERDCRVLESFKIIDYSLLLAVHFVDNKPNLTCYSDGNKEPTLGIPARTSKGEELLLFIGIIDILQSYKFRKKVEHTLKSIIYEKDSISVHRPDFYSRRFQNFLLKTVFQPVAKRKSSAQKVPLDSPCYSGSLLEESPLSFAWACSKAKFPKKPPTEGPFKGHPLKLCRSSLKEEVEPEYEEKEPQELESDAEELKENEIESSSSSSSPLKAANVVALEIN